MQPDKLQFTIASVLWLIVCCAVIFAALHYAEPEAYKPIIGAACIVAFLGAIVWQRQTTAGRVLRTMVKAFLSGMLGAVGLEAAALVFFLASFGHLRTEFLLAAVPVGFLLGVAYLFCRQVNKTDA